MRTSIIEEMATDGGEDGRSSARVASAFWWRLTDNAFRHLIWFLIPPLALAALGVLQASKTLQLYEASGVLSASSNPLVPDQVAPGAPAQFFESTADAASRTINEQLRTDKFLEEVAESAGLGEAVSSGFLDLDVVRSSVWSTPDGTSLVQVRATWADPQTAFALVQSTIDTYQDFLAEAVASDASEAVAFYNEQLARYRSDVEAAEQELISFVAQLPVEGEPSVAESFQLQRLTDALSAAESKVVVAENEIESAELTVAQSRSEAGRSLTVVDAPKLPTSPESTLVAQAMTVIAYMLLGVVIAVAALLISTVIDQSVSSTSDLLVDGVAFVATVPAIRSAHLGHRPRRKRGARAIKNRTTVHEREPVGV